MLCSPLLITLFFACQSEIDHKPAATVEISKTPSVPAAAKIPVGHKGGLSMSAQSTVAFVGAKVTSDHSGGFKKITGHASVDKNGAVSSINATIDIASTFADHPKLTKHLLSPDFFDVKTHPTAVFISTSIADGAVTGDLQLHGKTNEITFPASIEASAEQVSIKAEFTIDRSQWDIVYPGKPDNLIKNDVLIQLDIQYQ